jgi:hypothetical protein
MTSPDPELMQLFDFSVSDLNANREGKITAYQLDRLRENLSDNWFALACLPVVGFICFLCQVPLILESDDYKDPRTILLMLGGGLIIVFIIIEGCISLIHRSSSEVNNPKIQSIHGQPHVYMEGDRNDFRIHTLRVEQSEFSIKPSQYKGLSQRIQNDDKGEIYIVYYAEKTKTILSIEALS